MISLYYGAKLQHWLVHDQSAQQEASEWGAPGWRDRIEGKGKDERAPPADLNANPYRRYLRDHNLPLETVIPAIDEHSFKCWARKSTSLAIYPLKNIAGTIESTVQLIASLVLGAIHIVGDEHTRRNIASVKAAVLPPSKNFKRILACMAFTAIEGGAALVRIYKNDYTICNLDKIYRREMDELTGAYVPLWKINAEAATS